MNDQVTWEFANPQKLVESINNTKVDYCKLDMRWRVWFEEKNWIMDQLRGKWYMRRFVPENDYSEKEDLKKDFIHVEKAGMDNQIKLDDPFPPQGDLIVFLLIGDTRDYEAAEAAAKEIEEYFKKNSDKYIPKLRIRSILFETASAYVAQLTKESDACMAILGQPEVEKSLCEVKIAALQHCHKELIYVDRSVNRMYRNDKDMIDKLSLAESWRQLQKKCLSKASDASKYLERYKDLLDERESKPILTKTMGGLYE